MLKIGDWIEPINPERYYCVERWRYQKVKDIEVKDGYYLLEFYSGFACRISEGEFRVLSEEEIKEKGLDKEDK